MCSRLARAPVLGSLLEANTTHRTHLRLTHLSALELTFAPLQSLTYTRTPRTIDDHEPPGFDSNDTCSAANSSTLPLLASSLMFPIHSVRHPPRSTCSSRHFSRATNQGTTGTTGTQGTHYASAPRSPCAAAKTGRHAGLRVRNLPGLVSLKSGFTHTPLSCPRRSARRAPHMHTHAPGDLRLVLVHAGRECARRGGERYVCAK